MIRLQVLILTVIICSFLVRSGIAQEQPTQIVKSQLGYGFGEAIKLTGTIRVIPAGNAKNDSERWLILITTVGDQKVSKPIEMDCGFFDTAISDQVKSGKVADRENITVIGYETVHMDGLPLGVAKYLNQNDWNEPAMHGWHISQLFVVVAVKNRG